MTEAPDTLIGSDGRKRCYWAAQSEDYQEYHDAEWGFPTTQDHLLFEKICLEGFQAGLSWLTILRKRPAFRECFLDFDFEKLARFNKRSVDRLLRDKRIVRHRGKIESVLNNAKRACELVDEQGSLSEYLWSFLPPPSERPKHMTRETLRQLAQTPTSAVLSRELKKRGWSFIGPTTAYAFMQSTGIVNDHLDTCPIRPKAEKARQTYLASIQK